MVNVADITITQIETITAFNVNTGAYRWTLDELQSCSIAQSQETTDITGKQGRLLAKLKRNKSVTISADNGLISGGLMESQTGSEFSNKTTEVMWTDYLTVEGNSATTNYIAVGTEGAEIVDLYIKNTDSTLGTQLTQSDSASDTTFAYDPSTKTLTFSGLDDNTEIVVYYKRQIQADVLDNASDTYSGTVTLYVDVFGEDKCANVYRIQFYFPKVDVSGDFTLDMGDSQTVHSFEADALAGACGTGNVTQYFTYTIFGENAADVTDTDNTGDTGDTGDTGNDEP